MSIRPAVWTEAVAARRSEEMKRQRKALATRRTELEGLVGRYNKAENWRERAAYSAHLAPLLVGFRDAISELHPDAEAVAEGVAIDRNVDMVRRYWDQIQAQLRRLEGQGVRL